MPDKRTYGIRNAKPAITVTFCDIRICRPQARNTGSADSATSRRIEYVPTPIQPALLNSLEGATTARALSAMIPHIHIAAEINLAASICRLNDASRRIRSDMDSFEQVNATIDSMSPARIA